MTRAVWRTIYGLVVDDGQLAIGIVAALALTWLLGAFGNEALRENAGWLLLALLVVLVLGNLYRVAQTARHRAEGAGRRR